MFDGFSVTHGTTNAGLGDLPPGWDDMSGIEVSGVVGVNDGSGVTGLTPGPWGEGIDGWGGFGDQR